MNTNHHWQGGMLPHQIAILEDHFAYLTEAGWVIPAWVQSLAQKIARYQESPISAIQHPRPKQRKTTKADLIVIAEEAHAVYP